MVYIRNPLVFALTIDEGGYAAGGNANHDPTHLIHLSNFGMIAVTVQYRVFLILLELTTARCIRVSFLVRGR